MGESGSYDEILEYAIDKEIDAYHFYLALAERVDTPEMRQVFESLAQEELEHKDKLELELMKLGRTVEKREPSTAPQREDYILSNSQSPLNMDYKNMLLLGMEKEEASFRTYINLLPNAQDSESREMLLSLAEEEVRHKLRFEVEYDMLMKKE